MEGDFNYIFNKALEGHPVVFTDALLNSEFEEGEVLYLKENPVFPSDILILGDRGNSYSVNKLRLLYSGIKLWEEPLEFYHWHLIKDEFKYIFKTYSGDWLASEFKPSFAGEYWEYVHSEREKITPLKALSDHLFPECDWQRSLIKRED